MCPTAEGNYTARAGDHRSYLQAISVEITSGLQSGDKVVTEGAAFLREPAGD